MGPPSDSVPQVPFPKYTHFLACVNYLMYTHSSKNGFIEREVYSEHPLRAEYRPTERGRSLLPVLLAIGRWGLENTFEDLEQRDRVARAIYDQIPESRPIIEEAGIVVRSPAAD
jgi:DNA-binding HxlR family transcriptional regulator